MQRGAPATAARTVQLQGELHQIDSSLQFMNFLRRSQNNFGEDAMISRLLLSAFLVFGAAGLAATPSLAATLQCTTDGAGNSDATFSLGSASDVACFSGNDTNTINAAFTVFGLDGWTLAAKTDKPAAGNKQVTFTTAPVNGSKGGDWAISNPNAFGPLMITLKAGDGFAAFLLDSLAGTWSSTKGLSHASIYYRNGVTPPPPAPVPLPASALLLIGGMGGLVVLRRRKTA
ncbi:MAG: VPLPA-CTERM sorting domain-containing protein [Rubrimonas sp.]